MSDWRSVRSVAELKVPTILISENEKYFECFIELETSLINVKYEWPKDRNLKNSIKHFKWFRVKYLCSYKGFCRVGSTVFQTPSRLPSSSTIVPLLPVVSNCQTFTLGRRGGGLFSASVLFLYFWNYPLSLGLQNVFRLQYPCAGVLDLVAWTSVCFCFVYWDVATQCKHELVTVGVELSWFFFCGYS